MESPDISYGRLLGFLDVSSYSAERAVHDFKKLIKDDAWKEVGSGFDDINVFLKSISLANYKIGIEDRKEISVMLEEINASQRATAKALGVGRATVQRDIGPDVPLVGNNKNNSIHNNELKLEESSNGPDGPPTIKTGAALFRKYPPCDGKTLAAGPNLRPHRVSPTPG